MKRSFHALIAAAFVLTLLIAAPTTVKADPGGSLGTLETLLDSLEKQDKGKSPLDKDQKEKVRKRLIEMADAAQKEIDKEKSDLEEAGKHPPKEKAPENIVEGWKKSLKDREIIIKGHEKRLEAIRQRISDLYADVLGPVLSRAPSNDGGTMLAGFAGGQRLPKGSLFATAQVEPDTQIRVNRPGRALVASANVMELKRVNPGDTLDAKTTSSIQFDDGTGVLVNIGKIATPIAMTAGLVSLLDGGHKSGIPMSDGTATTFIGGQQPFNSAVLQTPSNAIAPSNVPATFINPQGQTVGQLCNFEGLDPKNMETVKVATLDSSGSPIAQQPVPGGVVDGTVRISFDRQTYHTSEAGVLRIEGQEAYRDMIEATRQGGLLKGQPILLVWKNAVGAPSQVPFGTTEIRFKAGAPGPVNVEVFMPGSALPSLDQPSGPQNIVLALPSTIDLDTGAKKLSDLSNLELEALLQDLNQRKDYDWAANGGKPGSNDKYLWGWVKKVTAELKKRGYFELEGKLLRPNGDDVPIR